MAINVKQKGNAAERQAAKVLYEALGIKLIRNFDQVVSGGFDLVVSSSGSNCGTKIISLFSNMALEVKHYKTATYATKNTWWEQTLKQSLEYNNIPILMYKVNNQRSFKWRIVVPIWFILYENSTNNRTPDNSSYADTADMSVEGFKSLVLAKTATKNKLKLGFNNKEIGQDKK